VTSEAFEPATTAIERPQTYVFDSTVIGIGSTIVQVNDKYMGHKNIWDTKIFGTQKFMGHKNIWDTKIYASSPLYKPIF
jgi:hypothetical protein